MAHFAKLDQENIVEKVIVINNLDVIDVEAGRESEQKGVAHCKNLFGEDTKWVQTSYNKSFRYNYASPGYKYDEQNDAFIPPQPYPSWVLNTETFTWDPPIPEPDDNKIWVWNEASQTWTN